MRTDHGEKRRLRERMRRARAAIPPDERAQRAAAIRSRLRALPELRRASGVMVFASFGSEVSTEGILRDLHDAGKRVYLPYLEGRMIEAAEIRPDEPLTTSGYGPEEPTRRTPVDPRSIDVVVAPGLAFDRRGRRLGYGGGAYDRFLARLRPEAVLVGVGFREQVVEEVPAGPGDVPVHLVVTDREVLDARPSDGRSEHRPL